MESWVMSGSAGGEEVVRFYSDGLLLEGSFYRASHDAPMPAIVFCPGSRVSRRMPFYATYIPVLVANGVSVLLIDYRGWGGSKGDRGTLYPLEQVADIRAGLAWLETRDEVDASRMGLFGVSMGGAHAMAAAGLDERAKAVVAVLSPMDGREMLRASRREHEFRELEATLRDDRRRRVLTGDGEVADGLGPVTPERSKTTALAQDAIPPIPLACVDAIYDYRPIDYVARISPRAALWVSATRDPVCPPEHSRRAYAAAGAPKRLVEIEGSEHYGTYTAHAATILSETVAWYDTYLQPGTVHSKEER
jgi:dipeptidyl aminopeptidase/acylaminoacyl peptidase